MPTAPYLIVGFDIDPDEPDASAIIEDVRSGFPANARPIQFAVRNLYSIDVVPPSQAIPRFNEVGMYLILKDAQHGGILRWVLQLCRVDEIATG